MGLKRLLTSKAQIEDGGLMLSWGTPQVLVTLACVLSRRGSRENPDRFTDNRAPKAQESRGVRGHAPLVKFFLILIA